MRQSVINAASVGTSCGFRERIPQRRADTFTRARVCLLATGARGAFDRSPRVLPPSALWIAGAPGRRAQRRCSGTVTEAGEPWVVGTGYRPATTRGDVVVAPVEIRIVSRRLSPSQCLTARAACAEGRPVEAGAGLPPGVLFMDPALDSTRTPPAEREPGAQVTRNDRDQEPGAGGRALVGNAPQGIESDGGDDGDVQQAASCDAWVIADHVRVPSSFTDPLCRRNQSPERTFKQGEERYLAQR